MTKVYPIGLNLHGKNVLVVGGGRVAAHKIQTLLGYGAHIIVVSPTIVSQIDRQTVEWHPRNFEFNDLQRAQLVFACTNDPILNMQIYDHASASQWVNNTSDRHHSDFYNMAVIKNAEITLTISTNGHSPKEAKRLKKELMTWLESNKEKR